MNKKLIELIIMIILIAVLGKGLVFGLGLGIVVSIGKVVANKFGATNKQIEEPFSSVGLGAIAGLIVSLVRFIL